MDTIKEPESVTIRPPATANLMIDASDRDRARYPSPWDFQINKAEALLNGFFHRVALTEACLEWDIPTIQSSKNSTAPNNILAWQPSSISTLYTSTQSQYVGTAADYLDLHVAAANAQSSVTGFSTSVSSVKGVTTLLNSVPVTFSTTTLAKQFNLPVGAPPTTATDTTTQIFAPDLRRYKFIDFVSNQLTYNQDLKDATSNKKTVDVIQRWYMAYDAENTYDKYGFPVYMGYKPFAMTKMYNPPKQIKWDSIQPVGNVSFQVWGEPCPQDNVANYQYNVIDSGLAYRNNWFLTLQVSEN
jgi:hypothetical protein